jgi:acetyl esterase/lipase
VRRHAYGPGPAQFGELSRPAVAAPAGTVVVLHGGFWRARYDLALGRPLAAELADRGYAVWNLEYRRVGGGGGWPGTFADVAAGIDLLAELDVDLGRVVAVGHSAGGQLAAWAAARPLLPAEAPGADPVVVVSGVISQAGVLDLAGGYAAGLGAGAVADLLGGSPADAPDAYAVADPMRHVPLPVPVVCVHARGDDVVPISQSRTYVAAATAAGGRAHLVETDGDHFSVIDVSSPDWAAVVTAIESLSS